MKKATKKAAKKKSASKKAPKTPVTGFTKWKEALAAPEQVEELVLDKCCQSNCTPAPVDAGTKKYQCTQV